MSASLAEPTADVVDECVQSFEAARRRGPAAVADHLPPADHPAWLATVAELVRVDLEFGWADGRPRPVADYLAEFPGLGDDAGLLAGVCFEEFRQRADRGEPADPADYTRRFGADTGGWDSISRPATAVVSAVAPVSLDGTGWGTTPGGVVPAFRFGDGSDSPSVPAADPDDRPGLLRELRASAPAVADRLNAGAAAFPDVGTEFAGFHLADELGRGAFARVFLAHQGELAGRPVALKVSAAKSDESATLAQLQHTNIVPIYSVHRHGPLVAVCMPYFGATTLADVATATRRSEGGLPRSGRHIVSTLANRKSVTRVDSQPAPGSATSPEVVVPLAAPARAAVSTEVLTRLSAYSYVEAVLWLVARMADGLDHAHNRGIVHRDLKPANVLLTDDGQPMLLDFNLAADDNAPGAAAVARVGGTLPYMAPEHLAAFAGKGGTVDARSDLYSLGLIAFELLAGQAPFPNPAGPLHQVLPAMREQRSAAPPRLTPLNPAVSPAVESIVRTLLAPDPAARYQTARELKEDVERHLADRRLKHAPDPSRRERLAKWARRHPRLSSSATLGSAAAVLLLAVGAAAAGWREQNKRDQAEAEARTLRADKTRSAAALGALLADPQKLPAEMAAAGHNLERFGVLTDPNWEQRADVRRLSPQSRDLLRQDVGELLYLIKRAGEKLPDESKIAPASDAVVADAELLGRTAATLMPTDPNRPRAFYMAAFDQYGRGDYLGAMATARQAVEADAKQPAAWFILGLASDKVGAVAKAEAAYDVALALGGDDYHVRMNRGLVRLKSKQFRDAEADFSVCIALRPDEGDGYFNRAVARKDLDDPAGAVADLTAALAAGAPQTRVYFLRSRLHRQMKNEAAAAADLATGLKLTPTDAASWVSRGLARRATAPAAAVADMDQALAVNPQYTNALQSKASVLAEELKDQAGAAAALTRLLELNPRSVPALSGRAVVFARLGDRAKAVADAEATLAVGREPDTVYMVAGAYALLSAKHPDDKATALRLLTEALRGGYGFQHLATDPELAPLRDDPEFQRIVAAAKRLLATGR